MICLVNERERSLKIGLIMFVIGGLTMAFIALPQFTTSFDFFNPFAWLGVLKVEAFKILMGFFGFLLALAGTVKMILS